MFKHYFELVSNVEVYAIFSMILFVVIFAVMLIAVFRMDKSLVTKMRNIPFDSPNNETGTDNEH